MGKLLTMLLAGAGAYYWWRSRQVRHCPHCDRELRADARTCRFCGETVQEGPTIDVEAR